MVKDSAAVQLVEARGRAGALTPGLKGRAYLQTSERYTYLSIILVANFKGTFCAKFVIVDTKVDDYLMASSGKSSDPETRTASRPSAKPAG